MRPYHIKWDAQRTIPLTRMEHLQPTIKLSSIYWKPIQLITSLQKPKLPSCTTSSSKYVRCSLLGDTLVKVREDVDESRMNVDWRVFSSNYYTTRSASLWVLTGTRTKIQPHRTYYDRPPSFSKRRKTLARVASLNSLKTAVGKGRWEKTIGNDTRRL